MKIFKSVVFISFILAALYMFYFFFFPAYSEKPFYNISEKNVDKISYGLNIDKEFSKEETKKIISLLKSIKTQGKLESEDVVLQLGTGKQYNIHLSSGRIIYFSVDPYQITIDFLPYKTKQNTEELFEVFPY